LGDEGDAFWTEIITCMIEEDIVVCWYGSEWLVFFILLFNGLKRVIQKRRVMNGYSDWLGLDPRLDPSMRFIKRIIELNER
jgi:hypothetical protein